MARKGKVSRRDFVRSAALASGAIAAPGIAGRDGQTKEDGSVFFQIPDKDYPQEDPVAGMLFSQLGYEPGQPVRIMIRLPEKELMNGTATCRLFPTGNEHTHETECTYWGRIWQSHWWVATFSDLEEEGEWGIEITLNGKVLFRDTGLSLKSRILIDSTLELSSVDMLERRSKFTGVGAGWQDAGTLWVESPAQSGMIIALEEILEHRPSSLRAELKTRLITQVITGCNYLVMLEKKARELGHPPGAMSHDLHGHEEDILPQDVLKAVIALYRAARLLPDNYPELKASYAGLADRSYQWLRESARPLGDKGLSRFQRNLPEGTPIPEDEWQTRDLLSFCWAALERWKHRGGEAKTHCIEYAEMVMERQISQQEPEHGWYGHFREYSSMDHSEKAWAHGIVDNQFGADIGQFYPSYLMPLVEMLQLWPDRDEARAWKNCLKQFTYRYLLPACRKNPFYLVPLGIFGSDGPIWFCGTFHGTNTIYGYTAALASALARLFEDPELDELAMGNLQWLAGLNAGITRASQKKGCVVYSSSLPERIALPVSMICHIGRRWAGTWFQTRGVICNGFSTGEQFKYDVMPKKENDGPFSLTDEDWIPHSAGWLTALMHLNL